jgi:hypothetical protein
MENAEIRNLALTDANKILSSLEPDQLTGAKRGQLPRRYLKGSQLLVMWSLRLYLLFMIVVVVYQIFSGVQ